MRNLHDSIGREFGLENVAILRKWEQLEKKIADFKNHRRFTLRCLSQRITPNSLKLKSNIKSTKGKRILEMAERQLANECVRSINNTIATCTCLRDTCMKDLQDQISSFYFQECIRFIERVKETRHQTVLKRQLSNFDRLWQRYRGIQPQEHAENGRSNARFHKQRETTQSNPETTNQTITDTTTKEFTRRWVKNLLNTPLTEAQFSLLAHGPNFMIAPRHPPYGEYITAVEQACLKLEPHNAEELRAAMRGALRNSQEPISNTTKQEIQALAELKKDQERVILTADKGVAIVIMDKEDYQDKAKALLEDQGTYKALKTDPTGRLKSKMINLLKKIKSEGGIDDILYKKLYPTGSVTPKFYGLPKIHKDGIPLRPIVSSRGSISYEVAKELARILKPLVGSSPHHIKNTGDFIQQIKQVKLQADETITSYDVSALFTSVPIEAATKIIQRKLEQDQQLYLRTTMKVEHITSLLEFCLKTTYFQFQGSFYEQINGAAMGSPISPIVANLFMEEFEVRAIQTSKNPPKMWKRFVDDTCVILRSANKEEFFHHINSIDPKIQFTSEESKPDGSIPFLDCLVTPQADGSIMTAV